MNVGFFFENGSSDEGMDLRHIDTVCPIKAGTPYLFFLIAHLLAVRDNGISVTLFLWHRMVFNDAIRVECVGSLSEAHHLCAQLGINYLVVKHSDSYWETIKQTRAEAGVRYIVWCHNFVSFRRLRDYAKCDAVARLICVGREQADIYRDHRAFRKTDWIYNTVDNSLFKASGKNLTPVSRREHIVTYVGAVIPGKGFHVLAKAWPEVLKAVPDAQLYVIGNGKLYGDDVVLGDYGLAEKSYEKRFMKYLTDDSGRLLPSVHLMGLMGREKYSILEQTKVGVPNPSGLTETFCNSAVEMQLMGAVIASRRCTGYMDTVETGKLIGSPRRLASCITDCLLASDDNYRETFQALEDKFSPETVILQWEELLLHSIAQGKRLQPLLPLVHPDYELKKYKEYLRKAKEQHPWLYTVLPSLGFFTELWKKIKWAVWKYTYLK